MGIQADSACFPGLKRKINFLSLTAVVHDRSNIRGVSLMILIAIVIIVIVIIIGAAALLGGNW